MSVIQRLPERDFDPFVAIVANAYPGFKIVTEEERQKVKQRLLKVHDQDPATNFYGLYREGQLLGGMRWHDFTMQLFSTRAKAGGVGLVAVDLAHKKEKVARDMIAHFLRHYRESGATIALLYPFRPDFYKKMGFGYGAKLSQYRVRPASLPLGASRAHIQFLQKDDKQALLACYNRYMAKTHGMIEKSAFELDGIFDRAENRVVGYKEGDRVSGYVVFTFQPVTPEGWVNDILVKEFIYETREALAGLLTFLHTQADQVNQIIFNLLDDHFHYLLLDPCNGSGNTIAPVYHESNVQGVGLMYRVTDTPGFFEVLAGHNFGGQSCKLKLSIADSFLAENDGCTVVHFEDGAARLKGAADYEVEIRLDVSDFSSLVMGVVSFKSLYRYNLADISEPRYVDTVNRIFRAEEKPVCTTQF